MSRQNQWFVLGNDIAREVITADIQRYLGPDALVKPGVGTGEYQGQPGYWITAYRTLTSQMIQDLRLDSSRWQQERHPVEGARPGAGSHSPYTREPKVSRGPEVSLVAYQDSRTHAARQHWGPTQPHDQYGGGKGYDDSRRESGGASRPAHVPSPGYTSSDAYYTTASNAQYASSGYQGAPASAAPRTQPADPYAGYQQPARDARDYHAQQGYAYATQPAVDAYGRPILPPAGAYASPSSVPAPGYYIASDGRQYPRSQQPPIPTRNPPPGTSRYSS